MVNSANHPEREAVENTSGQGKIAIVPSEIRGWNWGAFLLSWIWGIGNKVWIALLCLLPAIGFIVAIVLGIKGSEWAWRNKKWDSVEHFKRTQRIWGMGGVVLVVVPFILVLFAAVIIPNVGRFIGERQEGETETEAPPTPTLSIRNVELCSAISEDGDYIVQPGAHFDRGDVVWLYFDVLGIAVKRVDDKFECWATFSELKLFDPDGDIIANVLDLFELHDVDLDEPPEFLWFCAWFESVSDDPVGQYRFEFTVKDELSGATGTGSATFDLQ